MGASTEIISGRGEWCKLSWPVIEANSLISYPSESRLQFNRNGKTGSATSSWGFLKAITGAVDTRLLELFKRVGEPTKSRLVELLLKDRRREILAPALAHINSLPGRACRSQSNQPIGIPFPGLKVETKDDAREFLAALPTPSDVGQMLFRKSVLLGRPESFVWATRHHLRELCIEILGQPGIEEIVLFNALRVLAFLQDESALRFAEQSSPTDGQLKALVSFLPLLLSGQSKTENHRSRVFDRGLPIADRIVAFVILSRLGENTEQLFTDLISSDPSSREVWKMMIVMTSSWLPCKGAIPFIEEMLQDPSVQSRMSLLTSAITKLSELPGKR